MTYDVIEILIVCYTTKSLCIYICSMHIYLEIIHRYSNIFLKLLFEYLLTLLKYHTQLS